MLVSFKILPGDAGRDGLVFSSMFVGAVLALTTVLYAVDVATIRALFSLP